MSSVLPSPISQRVALLAGIVILALVLLASPVWTTYQRTVFVDGARFIVLPEGFALLTNRGSGKPPLAYFKSRDVGAPQIEFHDKATYAFKAAHPRTVCAASEATALGLVPRPFSLGECWVMRISGVPPERTDLSSTTVGFEAVGCDTTVVVTAREDLLPVVKPVVEKVVAACSR